MSEVAPLISDLAIILIIAGIVTVIFKWLKQPVILGYIVAGIMAGPSVSLVPTVSDPANIKIWADIGVIFLLFAMGLDFSFKKLINVGITAIVATVTIVCGMMFIGYMAGNAMGFSHMSSIFLGGMLSMSSTAIVFKASMTWDSPTEIHWHCLGDSCYRRSGGGSDDGCSFHVGGRQTF